ncbi:MAG: polyketide cyclase, partial [Pedobacter sp.]
YASEDWHTPYADNDLRTGGKFKSTMAAKDGSFSFDFEGEYTDVEENKTIAYEMADGRTVKVSFLDQGESTKIIETFDAEDTNSIDMQRLGWQAILDNFKRYAESK